MNKFTIKEYKHDLLKISDLTQIFRCCKNTIRNLIEAELLPSPFKIGRTNYFLKDKVEEYINCFDQKMTDDQVREKMKVAGN